LTGERLTLPAAVFGESYAKELQKIPLPDNTAGRRISDISGDLCDQLTDQLKTSQMRQPM
jgi:hypothetical protein